MIGPLELLSLPIMQRALVEIVILAALSGLIGAQIALRSLAFFAHGTGAATFPGLVLAGPLGIPAPLAALAASLGFAAGTRGGRLAVDARTALALVAALAIGIVLASDVLGSGAEVDQLLFGSLLAIGGAELATSAIALGFCAITAAAMHRRWLVGGFDPSEATRLGGGSRLPDLLLTVAMALAVVAAVDAVGALLVSAIIVVPALTVLPGAPSVGALIARSAGLAALEGISGLFAAFYLDAPPGATIAVLGGLVFAAMTVIRSLRTARGTVAA